jgi:hypothetical protein
MNVYVFRNGINQRAKPADGVTAEVKCGIFQFPHIQFSEAGISPAIAIF